MKISVLYISYTGLLDALGQSQVLQYVIGLAPAYRMTLLTFEKPEALLDVQQVCTLQAQCREAGIDWHYLVYHHRPRMPAALYDVVMGARKGRQLARSVDVRLVHCRSYLAGLMGLMVKRGSGVRHIFDMRGFWVDERVDGGMWRRRSLQYRVFKCLERLLFTRTDHIVSLTRAGLIELSRLPYLVDKLPPVSVIPTCTNLELFRPLKRERQQHAGFTLGYLGSAGSWYLFDDVARAVRLLFDSDPSARFLVINKTGHREIREALLREGVDMARVECKAVSFSEVAHQISRMDAGLFFIKPLWSKRASSPTRLGEFLACGKPVLTNGKVGDVEDDVNSTRTGVVINDMAQETLRLALRTLLSVASEPGIAERCRRAAETRFSLESGIEQYSAIYTSLVTDGLGSVD
jgi:glycosyltransferase involved in cell wall biosynthesis